MVDKLCGQKKYREVQVLPLRSTIKWKSTFRAKAFTNNFPTKGLRSNVDFHFIISEK